MDLLDNRIINFMLKKTVTSEKRLPIKKMIQSLLINT